MIFRYGIILYLTLTLESLMKRYYRFLFALIIIASYSFSTMTSDGLSSSSKSSNKRKLDAIIDNTKETFSSFSQDFFCKCHENPCSHIKIYNGHDIDTFVIDNLYKNFIAALNRPHSQHDTLNNALVALEPYDIDNPFLYKENKYRQQKKQRSKPWKMTERFCNHNLRINHTDTITPLCFVVKNTAPSLIKRKNAITLLTYGANPNTLSGKTDNTQAQFPLDFAKDEKIIESLIEYGGKASRPKTIDHLIKSGFLPKIILSVDGEKVKFSQATIQACRQKTQKIHTASAIVTPTIHAATAIVTPTK